MLKMIAAALLAVTMCSGCASTGVKTVRAAPERSLSIAAESEEVKELVVMSFLKNGYQLTKDSDYQLVFERRNENFMANLLLSSQYDSTVMTRVAVTIVGDKPASLSWRGYVVTNPGSAFERLTEITNNPDGDLVQISLRSVKAEAEVG